MFAGSILDLEPDTAYEVQFVLADPDGVRGEARKIVTVRTRPEPKPFAGGRVFHVYPPGFKGQKIEPSFEGLMCAYNLTCSGTDWATAGRPRVQPGRHDPRARRALQVQPARVHERPGREPHGAARRHLLPDGRRHGRAADRDQGRRRRRRRSSTATATSTSSTSRPPTTPTSKASRSGTPTSRSGPARSSSIGSKGLTVKKCRFENVGAGVFTNYSGSSNFYIADNWFIGRDDPNHVIGWSRRISGRSSTASKARSFRR